MQEMTGGRTVPRVFVVQMLKSQIFKRPIKFISDMTWHKNYKDVIFFLRVVSCVRQGGKFIGGGDDTAILSESWDLHFFLLFIYLLQIGYNRSHSSC